MADIENQGADKSEVSITVDRPEAGETLTVAVEAGQRVVLEFNPAAARFAVEGDDFILTLGDGAQVVFSGLVSAAQGADVPTLHFSGIDVDADVLMEQALKIAAGDEAEPIETAAGEDGDEGEGEEEAGDGGGSHYDDSFGELIAGLIKQGIIGETELGFGLIGNGGTEFLVEAEFLSEGYMLSGGGFGPLGAGLPDGLGDLPGTSVPGGGFDSPDPLPNIVAFSGSGEITTYSLAVSGMNIITNEATGNLQIPDELILYFADAKTLAGDSVANASISGPSYDGGTDNAHIWNDGGLALTSADAFNTWADDGNGYIRFHIGGGVGPFYDGSLTYEVADGLGGTGSETIGVENVVTASVGGYWTLDGAVGIVDEVLLGQDGKNNIFGDGGDDVIHGGHDSGGDILRGGDGDDVIFGGSGNDDLQGGNDSDTFIMRAGFSQDTVDGDGDGDIDADTDIISLDSVLTGADVAGNTAIDTWLTLTGGATFTHDSTTDTITLSDNASGTIDLGGGDVITFANIEQIDYALIG